MTIDTICTVFGFIGLLTVIGASVLVAAGLLQAMRRRDKTE